MRLSRTWARTSLIFLVIAMAIGVFLRMSFFYNPIVFNYKYVLHTHSHVILLGWAFNAIAVLLCHQYKDNLNEKLCRVLFYLFQVSIIGMLFTFPIQGYALYSITFSTMHILVSYVFIAHLLKAIRGDSSIAAKFIRLSAFFYLISTIGPFSLGPIIVKGFSGTPLYDLAIYFYLHFLYNGFFVLAILGIFLKSIEHTGVALKSAFLSKTFLLLGHSVIPAFVLSMFCYYTFGWLYVIGVASGSVQIIGLYTLLKFLKENKPLISKHYGNKLKFLYVALMALGLKIMLQFFSALPFTTDLICNTHALIIAYLHLVFIGLITFSLIGFLFLYKLLTTSRRNLKPGFILLTTGFLFSEFFIAFSSSSFAQSILRTQNNYILVFVFSLLMLFGVLITAVNKPEQSRLP